MGEGKAFSKRWLMSIMATVALAGCQPEASPQATNNAAPPPVAVDVVKVMTQSVEVTSTLPGRTSAYRIAEVRPQVSGIVTKRLFVEGTQVEQGDILFALDPATYQATLASAKANLAKAEATLSQTEYQAKRYRELVAKKSVSQQDYEDAQASYKEALASVAAAKANVHSAQINLDYTQIKAPISGRIGRTLITEGALVTANQTNVLATIQQLDPLYVDLSQPSTELLKLRQSAGVDTQELSGIQLFLDDGTPIEQQATLQFAEVSVNENTGTVNVRATVDNPNQFLLPGLYVRAAVPTERRANGILIAQAAVSRNARGEASVFIVNEQNQVEKRTITTSRTIGNQWLVDSGLQAGELVIVKGLQKIQPGSTVTTNVLNDVKEQ
ncbi:efflux RND transporter periplasmic adaptor subunit [Vibrio cincinnatiensis]|uniref:efflux RND transporter periplasmic adaptor subunit n=1 Tax=Vibrio cincinnatiensis TaxID=675 RepID=UPI001EDF1F4A|nr:efflux RND transporter periplasmic adaptor subunit [Vibrio cincinnatiensis]MCG3730624.1 efflux RND transporter periplasmic adaptor subunit [Vibrio cincinnatiensis]MCG3734400.1 efflux RND transporter periplasmic adaptor subunit [Vibrio cincinnatiensis]MCG3741530.1 efflux RND transporter periplasmic adaptor subunit [Vibrio cincinnatiensis]